MNDHTPLPAPLSVEEFVKQATDERLGFDAASAKRKLDDIQARLENGMGRLGRDDVANLVAQINLQKYIIDKVLPDYKPIDRSSGKSGEGVSITLNGLKVT
jgi:hypothetical protein